METVWNVPITKDEARKEGWEMVKIFPRKWTKVIGLMNVNVITNLQKRCTTDVGQTPITQNP